MSFVVNILSLFPEIFPGPLSTSITGKAITSQALKLNSKQIRDYADNRHQTVDDTPYGGGSGMVMKPDVLGRAIDDCFIGNDYPIIYLSPRGKTLTQSWAKELASGAGMNILCGRYEGIDERVIVHYNMIELSIGDYILTCGDIAALVLLDAVTRLLPGVIEQKGALEEESFATHGNYSGLLEYPHYTRPHTWKGISVPEVLTSGNHMEIDKWRLKQALNKTMSVRPDLLKDQCSTD